MAHLFLRQQETLNLPFHQASLVPIVSTTQTSKRQITTWPAAWCSLSVMFAMYETFTHQALISLFVFSIFRYLLLVWNTKTRSGLIPPTVHFKLTSIIPACVHIYVLLYTCINYWEMLQQLLVAFHSRIRQMYALEADEHCSFLGGGGWLLDNVLVASSAWPPGPLGPSQKQCCR